MGYGYGLWAMGMGIMLMLMLYTNTPIPNFTVTDFIVYKLKTTNKYKHDSPQAPRSRLKKSGHLSLAVGIGNK
jgi:hypothetical protein